MQIATADDVFLIDTFKLQNGVHSKPLTDRLESLVKDFFANEVEK